MPTCAIVVVDNDGGGIFSFLPQATSLPGDRFEALFGTPHGTDLVALAAAHGLDATTVTTATELVDRIRRPGPSVTRIATDRADNVRVHAALNAAVAAALSRVLNGLVPAEREQVALRTWRSGADEGGEHGLELGLGLGELGERVAVGDDAAAGVQAGAAAVRRRAGRSGWRPPTSRCRRRRPSRRRRRSDRGRRPRPRRSAPAPRRGDGRRAPVSATARAPARRTFGRGVDSSPSMRVPRCCTLATVTIDGSGSQSRKLHHGSSVSWTTSMTTRCSTWFFVLATRAAAISASRPASPVRGAVPASGCERTVSPSTSTSSSGDAPIRPSTAYR